MGEIFSFGDWVRRRRKALDLTQDELAPRASCAVSMIRKIELDERRPSKQLAALLADALELPDAERDMFLRAARAELATDQLAIPPAPDVPSTPPPLHTLAAARSNLPTQPTSLIGRERNLAAVKTILAHSDARLLTLSGPGGTGKTRLALQLAADLAETYRDGVVFVDLAPLAAADQVLPTIAQVLGVKELVGTTLQDRVCEYLQPKYLLLLLDNFEQVLDAAQLIGTLLRAAPQLCILVTSRVVLRLSGEHEYAVPPLALPPTDDGRPTTDDQARGAVVNGQLSVVGQYAAIQLFVARAQAVQAAFALTEANAASVAAICRRLDGLPLAIELAAARIKLFSPQALLARLNDRLGLLTGGARDLPARQQTLRATIDWSYNLLNADEQRLFRRLAVFVGGWTLGAVDAVGQTDGDPRFDVLTMLSALVDHSLVQSTGDLVGEPRYSMLETLREYALERLRAAGEEIDLRRRHAVFFAVWVEAVQPNVNDLETSERIRCELGNFRAALDWSLARNDQDSQYGLWLFGSVWELWFHRYPTEGGAIAERALASASARRQDIVAARIYNAAARLQKNPGGSTRSVELLERSLALARQYDDRPLQAEVLRHLGEATLDGDYQAATQVFEESLRICRELDDAEQEGWTTFNLGIVAWRRADLNQSERHYQRSLALFARLGHAMAQQMVLRNLSMLAERRGDHAAADDYLARAFALSDRFGWAAGFSPLIERGRLACQRGDYQRALDLLQQGYDQSQQLGNNREVWVAFMWQAVCHVELGDLARATQLCRQGLAIALENVDDVRISQIAMIVANVVMASGKHVTAACLLGCADSYLATISYKFEHDMHTDWKRLHDRALSACRVALTADAFDAAYAAGQALTLEQAVAEALGDSE